MEWCLLLQCICTWWCRRQWSCVRGVRKQDGGKAGSAWPLVMRPSADRNGGDTHDRARSHLREIQMKTSPSEFVSYPKAMLHIRRAYSRQMWWNKPLTLLTLNWYLSHAAWQWPSQDSWSLVLKVLQAAHISTPLPPPERVIGPGISRFEWEGGWRTQAVILVKILSTRRNRKVRWISCLIFLFF